MTSCKINHCRICKNEDLVTIFDLGSHKLSSRFPAADEPDPIEVPLVLVKCNDLNNDCCGLLQLSHNTSEEELYLNHYGYRSGLNNTMINHLTGLITEITNRIPLQPNDLVLDIGSNDSTSLRVYPDTLIKVGIDPTGKQFRQYYPDNVTLLPTFFNTEVFLNAFPEQKAKVVTTISMFYDLPDPLQFVKDIKTILAPDGIWVSEQSYCITMLEQNSFDTIVHEHLEYYTIKQLKYIADQVGLEIIDISLNSCNGGSFRVTMSHPGQYPVSSVVDELIRQELELNLSGLQPLHDFVKRCEDGKQEVMNFLRQERDNGKKIDILAASTKGNTTLQYYGVDNQLINKAGERNPEKFGRRTPGTNIPIVSELEMREDKPDYLLALAWHFKTELLLREDEFLQNGGAIVFPLPVLEIYRK